MTSYSTLMNRNCASSILYCCICPHCCSVLHVPSLLHLSSLLQCAACAANCLTFSIHISQGSVASYLRCGACCKFTTESVGERFWKSLNIWGSYGQQFGIMFVWLTVYYHFYGAWKGPNVEKSFIFRKQLWLKTTDTFSFMYIHNVVNTCHIHWWVGVRKVSNR